MQYAAGIQRHVRPLRHEPGAEEYFERLPSYLQDRIRPRYQMVNSFATLEACAERFCGPE